MRSRTPPVWVLVALAGGIRADSPLRKVEFFLCELAAVPPIDAPFFNDQGVLLEGNNYRAQLYAGVSPGELIAVGHPVSFLSGADRGYFLEGSGTVIIDFILPGREVWVQVRAWEAAGGSSFESAAHSGHWTGISTELFLPYTGHFGLPPLAAVPLVGLVYPGPPIIVRAPQDQIAREGESAVLSVIASGGVTLRHQWYQGSSGETNFPAMGGTNATFTTPPLTTNSTFWVRVSSTAGETNSASAAVTVFPPKTAWLDMRRVEGLPALWIDGALDSPYRVQFSTGLDTWTDLIDLSLLTSPFLFVDPGASDSTSRFYRLLILSDGG